MTAPRHVPYALTIAGLACFVKGLSHFGGWLGWISAGAALLLFNLGLQDRG